jgi:hypothetical protein
MPYIRKEPREELDKFLQDLIKKVNGIMTASGSYDAGLLNYVITKILIGVELDNGVRYARINEVMGILECVKQEFYRRIAGPYEDKKKEENGDVY